MRGEGSTVFAPTTCTYKVRLAIQSSGRFAGHIANCPASNLINLVLVEVDKFSVPIGHLRSLETGFWKECLDV